MGFADDHLIPLVDEGLGNSTCLLDLGDCRALVMDASRDLRALRVAAGRRGLRIAFAADTHLHADFLSGASSSATTPAPRSWPPPRRGRPHRRFGTSCPPLDHGAPPQHPLDLLAQWSRTDRRP
ncbi:hypothetical protein ABZ079_28040 [Streptomyces sp. NPDC006314]|uniref:hypothetical protein n=1 Tax=Streptomyces sp. NPDC006314 TaxID=3154475 RepID=UPI0033B71E6A